MPLGYVETTVKQNLPLKSCTIVLNQVIIFGHAFEQGMEVAVSFWRSDRESGTIQAIATQRSTGCQCGCTSSRASDLRGSRSGRTTPMASSSTCTYTTTDTGLPLHG